MPPPDNPWAPFNNCNEFQFANFHFVENQTSASKIDTALDMWAAQIVTYGGEIPWKSPDDMYATIDSIQHGECPWESLKICYQGPMPALNPPAWMTETYELCTRNSRTLLHQQLRTTTFNGHMRYAPYMQFDRDGNRIYSDVLSADFSWVQTVSSTRPLHSFMTNVLF